MSEDQRRLESSPSPTGSEGDNGRGSSEEETQTSVGSMDNMPIEDYLIKQMELATRSAGKAEEEAPTQTEQGFNDQQGMTRIDHMSLQRISQAEVLRPNDDPEFVEIDSDMHEQQEVDDRYVAASLVIREERRDRARKGDDVSATKAKYRHRLSPEPTSLPNETAQVPNNVHSNLSSAGSIHIEEVNSHLHAKDEKMSFHHSPTTTTTS